MLDANGNRVLWLSRDSMYRLWTTKPGKDVTRCWHNNKGDRLFAVCSRTWETLMPSLELRAGTCRKVKLVPFEGGMQMVWADKIIIKG